MSLGKFDGVADVDLGKVSNVSSANVNSVNGVALSSEEPEVKYANYAMYQDGEEVGTDNYYEGIESPVTSDELVVGLPGTNYRLPPWQFRVDNIIISNDYDRDLYAVRNSTTKPSGADIVFFWRMEGSSNKVTWDVGDYNSNTPTISYNPSDEEGEASLDTDNYMVGSASFQAHSETTDEFYPKSITLTGLGGLPDKGRIGFWVRGGLPGDEELGEARYGETGVVTIGTNVDSGEGTRSGISLIFGQMTASPYSFHGYAIVSAFEDGSPLYQHEPEGLIEMVPGEWYFVEFAFDLKGSVPI